MTQYLKFGLPILLLFLTVFLLNDQCVFDQFLAENKALVGDLDADAPLAEKPPSPPETLFGLPLDSFDIKENIIAPGESFSDILTRYGVGYPIIHRIAEKGKDVFDLRQLRSGKPYWLFCRPGDSLPVARYMVYQPDLVNFFVFDLSDSAWVHAGSKEVCIREKHITGRISSSLYETIVAAGGSPALVMELSQIYAWTIDFFRIDKGDYFKVVYEEKYIDDTVQVGIGRILAADFGHRDKDFYAFWFQADSGRYSDYFDESGANLRKAFLRAPLEYARISSRYTRKRFHPVLKRYKAHLGTDYAAPHGTPIRSTANGKVVAASYTRGNGNYVKVRHNAVYTTQYLHMSRFAKGIRPGKVVKQGEVIGYVGSTGLATGPHVCYRFWKNGVQVDPYAQDLPDAEPLAQAYLEEFKALLEFRKAELDALPLPVEEPGKTPQLAVNTGEEPRAS